MPNRRSPSTLNCWNKAWLICGHRVVCRSCGEGQQPMMDETPFRHRPTCNASGQEAQFPWKDLNSILQADLGEVRQKHY